MDDKFLYLLHEQPDPGFVKDLGQKLNESAPPLERWFEVNYRKAPLTRKAKFGWIMAIVTVSIFLLMTISPVRAIILAYPIEIAGRIFEVTDDYPGDNEADLTIIEPQLMALDEALAMFPYPVKLPMDVPIEYFFEENMVRVYLGNESLPDMFELSWRSKDQGLVLSVCGNCAWELGQIVAPASVEEILLKNGSPAVFIRGGWYENERRWNYEIAHTLEWQVDHVLYRLSAGPTMTPEQLIKIAESTIMK